MFFAVLAHDTPELLRPPRRLQVYELNAVTKHVQDFVLCTNSGGRAAQDASRAMLSSSSFAQKKS